MLAPRTMSLDFAQQALRFLKSRHDSIGTRYLIGLQRTSPGDRIFGPEFSRLTIVTFVCADGFTDVFG